MTNEQHIENLKKLLEQEPCEDEYIKVPKKALKYRTAGMVAYNVAWLREHWQMEMDIVYGVKPCEDAISRQAVLDINESHHGQMPNHINHQIWQEIKDLPPVNPQPKTGHWYIDERPESDREVICSNCEQPIFKYHKMDFDYRPKYCPNCGAKMVAPQEGRVNNG